MNDPFRFRSALVCYLALLGLLLMAPYAAAQSDESRELANRISEHLSTQEWLGPIAAIALSPFFGLACLSGMATYGPDFLRSHSALLGVQGPMNNPALFWGMTVLTVLTSLPRLTKVSKPIALLAEKLETYSAIVILVAIRFSSSFGAEAPGTLESGTELALAGVGGFSTNLMFSIAAAVNLIVINTIKLSLEFFVWLLPIPMVDTFFEVCNKTLCAGLAFLYAYSPWLSLGVNVLLFIACALIFLQVTRWLRYFKGLYIWPLFRAAFGIDESAQPSFPAYLEEKWKGIPSRSELTLIRRGENRVEVHYDSWVSTRKLGEATWTPRGAVIFADRIELTLDGDTAYLEVRKGTL